MALNFLGVTLTLAAILFVYQVGTVLARAAELQYPQAVVLGLIGLGAAQTFSTLLPPLGLLLGIVLALGRLYHDSEMVAAQACGLNARRSYAAMLALALPVAALSAWFSLQLAPQAAAGEARLRQQALQEGLKVPLEAGQFRSLNGGRTVVYARSVDQSGDLRDVFIKRSRGDLVETTVAQRARRVIAADGTSQSIELFDGERLEGIPGTQRYSLLRFPEATIPLITDTTLAANLRIDQRPTMQLLGSADRKVDAELQWRLSLPVMSLVVATFAMPLGRLRPRQGRYSRVGLAVLLFASYSALSFAARSWLERGLVPAGLGMWWVHGLFLLLALAWILLPRWRNGSGA